MTVDPGSRGWNEHTHIAPPEEPTDSLILTGDNATISSPDGPLIFAAGGGEDMRIQPDGHVRMNRGLAVDALGANNGTINPGPSLIFGGNPMAGSGEGIGSRRTSGGNQFGLDLYTGAVARLQIANTGPVTINSSLTLGGHLNLNNFHLRNGTQALLRYSTYTGGETLNYAGGPNGYRWVNEADTVQLMSLTTPAGNLGVTGSVTAANFTTGGSVSASGRVSANDMKSTGGYMYYGAADNHLIGSGNIMYYRSVDGAHQFQNTAGAWGVVSCSGVSAAGNVTTPIVYMTDTNYRIQASASRLKFWGWDGFEFNVAGTGGVAAILVANASFPGGSVTCGGNYSSQGQAVSAYSYYAPNGGAAWGQGIANAWVTHSSKDFKTAIEPLADPLALVKHQQLHGVKYKHIGLEKSPHELQKEGKTARDAEAVETPSIGFVADDWLPLVPEIVSTDETGKPIGMDYARVGAITFQALKQLAAQVDALEARLAEVEGK